MAKIKQSGSAQSRYAHIAARVFDTPLLIEHSKLLAILNVLGPRLGFDAPGIDSEAIAYADPERHMDLLARADRVDRRDDGFFVADGVGIVPIIGTLVQRSDFMSDISGMTSYAAVEQRIFAALDDPAVREIVLEIDSPGGEVAGAFDLADRIFEARGDKPITAVATEFAASAAFLIASAADEIVVPRTGSVGSVGVVASHVDYSKSLDKRGVAVTLIFAGDKKVDGNPFQPLPDSVRAEWQAEINAVYDLFVTTVARNRNILAERVRDTQAGMFMGFKAIEMGMADRVNSFSNELNNAILRKKDPKKDPYSFSLGSTSRKETQMQDEAKLKAEAEAKAKAEAEAETQAKAQAEAEAKAAAEVEAKAAAEVEAKAAASATAQELSGRQRVKAILESDEAKGREILAKHLAFDTDLSVDQAKNIMKNTPKGTKLDEAMSQFNPQIRAEEIVSQGGPKMASTQEVYKFYNEQMAKQPTKNIW